MTFCSLAVPALLAVLAVPALPGEVTVTAEPREIPALGETRLTATLADPARQPAVWHWRITPGWAGRLQGAHGNQVTFQAAMPFLAQGLTQDVTVEAWPAGDPGAARGTVVRLGAEPVGLDAAVESVLRDYLGHPPFQPREARLEFLAGHGGPGRPAPDPASCTNYVQITGLAWTQGHPDPAFRGHALVLDGCSGRLLAVGPDGQGQPWLGHPWSRMELVDWALWRETPPSRPGKDGRGSAAQFDLPWAVAVRPGRAGQAPWAAAVADGPWIRTVDAQGTVATPLDLSRHPATRGTLDDLPGGRQSVSALAYGPDGVLHIAAGQVIYRFAGAGLEVLAGNRDLPVRDGAGRAAGFDRIRGLAADPDTGDLWVTDGRRLRKVTPGGIVQTAAVGGPAGPGAGTAGPGPEPPPELPGFDRPGSLAVFRGLVLVADDGHRTLQVFDPVTGDLRTLVGGPEGPHLPSGPFQRVRPGAGGAAPSGGPAALRLHLAVNEDGDGLVALRPDGPQLHPSHLEACCILRLTLPDRVLQGRSSPWDPPERARPVLLDGRFNELIIHWNSPGGPGIFPAGRIESLPP
jgi:hypothetical protein